jgi:hypothetical protein
MQDPLERRHVRKIELALEMEADRPEAVCFAGTYKRRHGKLGRNLTAGK